MKSKTIKTLIFLFLGLFLATRSHSQTGCDNSLVDIVDFYYTEFTIQGNGEMLGGKEAFLKNIDAQLVIGYDSIGISAVFDGKYKNSEESFEGSGIYFVGAFRNIVESKKGNPLTGYRYYDNVDKGANYSKLGITYCSLGGYLLLNLVTEGGNYVRFIFYPEGVTKEDPLPNIDQFGRSVWNNISSKNIDALKEQNIQDGYLDFVCANQSKTGRYKLGRMIETDRQADQYPVLFDEYFNEVSSLIQNATNQYPQSLNYSKSEILTRGYSDQKYLRIYLLDNEGQESYVEMSITDIYGEYRIIYIDRFYSKKLVTQLEKEVVTSFKTLDFDTFYKQCFKVNDILAYDKLILLGQFEIRGDKATTEDLNSLKLQGLQYKKLMKDNWDYMVDELEYIQTENTSNYDYPIRISEVKFKGGYYDTDGYDEEMFILELEDDENGESEIEFYIAYRNGQYILKYISDVN